MKKNYNWDFEYLFLNNKNEVVKCLTALEIYKTYHIRNMDAYLNFHDTIDGFTVIENDVDDDHVGFKKFHESKKYNYYVSDDGLVKRRNKISNEVTELKGTPNGKKVYVYVDGKDIALADLVIRTFAKTIALDSSKRIIYRDDNYRNCNIDNLKIVDRYECKTK